MAFLKLSKKGVFAFLLASALFVSGMSPAYADSGSLQKGDIREGSVGGITIVPYDMSVASGSYSGTEFQATYSLTSKNGKKVNFWVRNNGNVSVKLSIDGDKTRFLKPGESGHISVKVGYFTSDYDFQVVPTPNGGDIDIDYKIAQRDH